MSDTPRTADGLELCIGMTVWVDGAIARKVDGYAQTEGGETFAILDDKPDDRGRVTLWSCGRLWAVPSGGDGADEGDTP